MTARNDIKWKNMWIFQVIHRLEILCATSAPYLNNKIMRIVHLVYVCTVCFSQIFVLEMVINWKLDHSDFRTFRIHLMLDICIVGSLTISNVIASLSALLTRDYMERLNTDIDNIKEGLKIDLKSWEKSITLKLIIIELFVCMVLSFDLFSVSLRLKVSHEWILWYINVFIASTIIIEMKLYIDLLGALFKYLNDLLQQHFQRGKQLKSFRVKYLLIFHERICETMNLLSGRYGVQILLLTANILLVFIRSVYVPLHLFGTDALVENLMSIVLSCGFNAVLFLVRMAVF